MLPHLLFGDETVSELVEHQVRVYWRDAAYQTTSIHFMAFLAYVSPPAGNGDSFRWFQSQLRQSDQSARAWVSPLRPQHAAPKPNEKPGLHRTGPIAQ